MQVNVGLYLVIGTYRSLSGYNLDTPVHTELKGNIYTMQLLNLTGSAVLQINLKGHVLLSNSGRRNFLNTFYYGIASTSTLGSVQDYVTDFLAKVWTGTTKLQGALNNVYIPDPIEARFIQLATNPFINYDTPATPSYNSGDRYESGSCVTIRKKTGKRGKSNKGSWHFGPLSEADTTLDELISTGLTHWANVNTACALSLAPSGKDVLAPWLISASMSQLGTDPVQIYYEPISSCVLNKTVGSIDKRRERPYSTN